MKSIEDCTEVYCTSEGSAFSYLTPEDAKEILNSTILEAIKLIDMEKSGYDYSENYDRGFMSGIDRAKDVLHNLINN